MSRGNIKEILKFPLVAYVKENGYLGIHGYHRSKDIFYLSSKSASDGTYAEMFKKQLLKEAKNLEKLKEYMDKEDVTLVYEVIKVKEDPHMIEYDTDCVILLAIIKNKILFEKLPHEEVVRVAEMIGVRPVEIAQVFDNWDDFKVWYDIQLAEDPILPSGVNVEGYVLEDAEGFQVKIKNPFYSYWKFIRNSLELIRLGHDGRHKIMEDSANERIKEFSLNFLDWAEYKLDPKEEVDIIKLRNMYFSEKGFN